MTPNYKGLYQSVMCIINTTCHSDTEKKSKHKRKKSHSALII